MKLYLALANSFNFAEIKNLIIKKILIPVALLLAATTAVISCKKDDKVKSRHDMFVGSWKIYQSGEDENGNGIWDANEMAIDSDAAVTMVLFNSNGTGNLQGDSAGVPMSVPINWNLQNNETDLRLIMPLSSEADTIIQKIVSIDESMFVLKDTTGTPAYFISFKKQ